MSVVPRSDDRAGPGAGAQRARAKPLADRPLYLVLDAPTLGLKDPAAALQAALDGGVDLVQYRDKKADDETFRRQAAALCRICRAAAVPFLLNDRVHLVCDVGADGVHLGQEDMLLDEARRILGAEALIGLSTHSLEQAQRAVAAGADYLGFGPVFRTPTKPELAAVGVALLRQVVACVAIPLYPIGGIGPGNIAQILATGARRCAVVSAILAAEDVREAAARLRSALEQAEPRQA